MNIIYLPGGPNDLNSEKIDMSEYIRRGTQINMATHKIVNFAEGTDDDDVVTLRGLTAYYRRGSPLDMNRQQINNLAPGSLADDAATLGQCSNLLRAYDEALSRAFSELGKSSSSGGSSAAGTAFGRASKASVDRASETAGKYQEVAAQTGSTLLSVGGSIVSNTANVIGNVIVGQVQQDLSGKFVAKPIVENLDMTRHQIKELADGTK